MYKLYETKIHVSFFQEEQVELPYCTIHTLKPWSDKGWAEQKVASLPNVKISLKVLEPRIQQLLTTHNGSLPLPRYIIFFLYCLFFFIS